MKFSRFVHNFTPLPGPRSSTRMVLQGAASSTAKGLRANPRWPVLQFPEITRPYLGRLIQEVRRCHHRLPPHAETTMRDRSQRLLTNGASVLERGSTNGAKPPRDPASALAFRNGFCARAQKTRLKLIERRGGNPSQSGRLRGEGHALAGLGPPHRRQRLIGLGRFPPSPAAAFVLGSFHH